MKRYVYFIDVGNLPKPKAQEYMDRIKADVEKWWPKKGEWLITPSRSNGSRIERFEVEE
jgi:hypothetical protein